MRLFLAAALFALPASAGVLYNGALSSAPGAQGALVLYTNTTGVEVPGTFQQLDTSASNSTYAGYFNRNLNVSLSPSVITPGTFVNPAFPILDPLAGFTLEFTSQIVSETHSKAARAAFSVILLGNDSKGVEIGFQSDTIFSQATGFTIAESATGGPIAALLAAMTTYDLSIQGSNYSLTSGGTTLLSGSTKDYTTSSGFGSDVYRATSFVFLGDDTTSAGGVTNLQFVAIGTPEPSAALLAAAGLALLYRRRTWR